MTLQEFIKKYTGVRNVGNTDVNKGECVGLVMVYIKDLGLSHIWGNARDIYYNASELEWFKTPNSLTKYPKAGDIMFFDKTWGGGFGHTGIIVKSDPVKDSYTIFEQNLPLGSAPKTATRTNWNGVIGWITPKIETDDDCEKKLAVAIDERNKALQERQDKDDKYEEMKDKYATDMEAKDTQVEQLTKNLSLANEQNASYALELKNERITGAELKVEADTLKGDIIEIRGKNEALGTATERLSKEKRSQEAENEKLRKQADGNLQTYSRWRAFIYFLIGR